MLRYNLPRRAMLFPIAVLLSGCGTSASARSGTPSAVPSANAAAPGGEAAGEVPSGVLVVANQMSASASIIELPSGAVTEVPVGEGPHEAALTDDGRLAIVTVYGGGTPGNQLAVIDVATKKVVRMIDLGEYRRPHGVVAVPGSPELAAVTSEATQNVVIVDILQGEVVTVIPTEARGSHMVAITADGDRAFTANIPDGSVTELDLEEHDLVSTTKVATMTEGVAVTHDGREVWVGSNDAGTVTVFDTERNEVVATIPGFQMPYRLGISADGRLAVVCDPAGNAVHMIDVATRSILGSVTGLGSPRGVSIAPDGRTVFVTLNAGNAVAIVDVAKREVLRTIPVGASPDGVAFGRRR